VESITCRWCGPVGRVQEFEGDDGEDAAVVGAGPDGVAGGTVADA
jgi:hypothetical protein